MFVHCRIQALKLSRHIAFLDFGSHKPIHSQGGKKDGYPLLLAFQRVYVELYTVSKRLCGVGKTMRC